MIIKGKLIRCKREVKTFKGKESKEQIYITIAECDLNEDQLKELREAFKDAGKNFTPDWVLEPQGYVNLKTEFKLACRDLDGNDHESIEEFIKTFGWVGADVAVSVNVKEGAVYPNAIVFKSVGKDYNPFAEFDNDEED